MTKSIKRLMKLEKEKYRIPHKVQDLIPIDCIYKDGIFRSGQIYSKSFRFTDINYQVATTSTQKDMLLNYAAVLNGLECGADAKITANTHRMGQWNFERSVLLPSMGDFLDPYRKEYNDILLDKTLRSNGTTQEKYITISICKRNIGEARRYFTRVGSELFNRFAILGNL